MVSASGNNATTGRFNRGASVGAMEMLGRLRIVTRADRAWLAGELAEIERAIGVTERACCCPARPVVRVVMAASATRPKPVDLLLCGHHYRAGQAALRAAGAAVYDEQGALLEAGAGQRRPHVPRQHQAVAAV
jgi:hypothetical protein